MDKYQEKLAFLRKRAGLTQEQLAEKLGISANYIHKLERGERKMTKIMRIAMVSILGEI